MPEGIATHSRAQEFYFGADGLLRRQDYTLDIADGSRIANYALDIVDVDGIRIASKRRAYLCNKTYDVLRDRLIIRLDLGNFQLNPPRPGRGPHRSEEHTSELQSLMRISYAVFCLKKKKTTHNSLTRTTHTIYPHNS